VRRGALQLNSYSPLLELCWVIRTVQVKCRSRRSLSSYLSKEGRDFCCCESTGPKGLQHCCEWLKVEHKEKDSSSARDMKDSTVRELLEAGEEKRGRTLKSQS
jgi:hypothetical protein